MPPHGQEVELREAVMRAAPGFRQLHDELDALFQNGYCALMVKSLGLLDYDLDTRYKLLYTLSLMLGYPTATEARGRRVSWDIKPRDLPPGYYATYSEIPEPAEFHTDTQYYINPENYLILYVINPAADGSGETTLCSGHALKKRMLEIQNMGGRHSTFFAPRKFLSEFPACSRSRAKVTKKLRFLSRQRFLGTRLLFV